MTIQQGFMLPRIERDGKQVVAPSPQTEGWKTYFTGAGDALGPPLDRGEGDKLRLTFTDADAAGVAKEVELFFGEPVELHDGQAFYSPAAEWHPNDRMDFFVRMPATVTTPNGGSTGNCDRVASGLGYDVIVPAADVGAHDVDLTAGVPVPASGAGYWDVDRETGIITPSATPGAAEWHLLDLLVEAFLVTNLPLGNPLGVFDVDTYLVEWMHPNQRVVAKVTKNVVVSAGASAEWSAWLQLFRRKIT